MHNNLRRNRIRQPKIICRGHAIDKYTNLISPSNRINDMSWIGGTALLCQAIE